MAKVKIDREELKRRLKLGATGTHPLGKLNEDDQGGLRFAIAATDGLVRVEFGKELSWLAIPPDVAVKFAQALLEKANEAKLQPRRT